MGSNVGQVFADHIRIRNRNQAASNVARVKERIRRLDIVSAAHRARAIMDQLDDSQIAALVDDYNALA